MFKFAQETHENKVTYQTFCVIPFNFTAFTRALQLRREC